MVPEFTISFPTLERFVSGNGSIIYYLFILFLCEGGILANKKYFHDK